MILEHQTFKNVTDYFSTA